MGARMPIISRVLIFAFLLSSLNLTVLPSANAGCQDYPESVTPECAAANLAIAKLAQEAYEAAQAAKRIQEEQTARDNAAKDAADRAATTAADNALAPDDCARSTNRYVQSCVNTEVEKARIANEAKDAADRAATTAADSALAPDDCARSTNRFVQSCIDTAVEKARIANEEKNTADNAATVAADNALAPDDCARSTNRYVQSCQESAIEKARIANETIDSIRKALELDGLKMIADEKLKANNCFLAENKSLQICLDSAIAKNEVNKATADIAKKIRETQSSIAEPLLNAEGEIILNAVLKSKSLSTKDISNLLATRNLNSEDKNLISAYAQKLNGIKSSQIATSFKIPLSNSLSEEFTSATPKVCRVESGSVKTLKSGVCILNVKFSTDSGFEVETIKKIKIRK
jgi:hypothetical protein